MTSNSIRSAASLVGALAVVICAPGCAMTVPMRDMLGNREQFLSTNFRPDALPEDVRTAVARTQPAPARFRTISVRCTHDSNEEGAAQQLESTALYLDAGLGYVQRQTEYSRNGIPYRVNNHLTLLGVFPLMWQTGFHAQEQSGWVRQVREIRRLDRIPASPAAGDVFILESETGTSVQLAGFLSSRIECRAAQGGPASAYHAKLSGQAVPIECTYLGNAGTVESRASLLFLNDLGVALHVGHTSAKTKDTCRIQDVAVTR